DLLRRASPEVRERVFRLLFDHLRQGLAVDAAALDPQALEQVRETSFKLLRTPWGFGRDVDEHVSGWRWLVIDALPQGRWRAADDEMIVRGGIQSALGRKLRSSKLWEQESASALKRAEYME